MPRAILKNGAIVPIEPLPKDWVDGKELQVEEVRPETEQSLGEWYRELEAMCADSDPEDDTRLEEALRKADEMAKANVRKQMGL